MQFHPRIDLSKDWVRFKTNGCEKLPFMIKFFSWGWQVANLVNKKKIKNKCNKKLLELFSESMLVFSLEVDLSLC